MREEKTKEERWHDKKKTGKEMLKGRKGERWREVEEGEEKREGRERRVWLEKIILKRNEKGSKSEGRLRGTLRRRRRVEGCGRKHEG